MSTLRPAGPETVPERDSGRRRGFAAITPIARLFAPEHRDSVLLICTTLFLVGFGLVMVLSASSVEEEASSGDPFGRVARQALFAAIGVPLMLVFSRMPARFWKRWAVVMLAVIGVLQLAVFIPGLSYSYGGNQNWIAFGSFSMQPSEFLKFALIIWIGLVLGRRQGQLDDWRMLALPVAPVAGLGILLVLAGNDLGTATILLLIVFGCAYFAGARLWHLTVAGLGIALAAVLFAMTSTSRVERIAAWMRGCHPDDPSYLLFCWQPQHGLWALASGGVLGAGLGKSRSKWSWLPEADSDYIFAIIGEELGLIGSLVVLILFLILALTFVRMMRRTRDPFARIVTGGVFVWVIGQAFVNIAVVLGLLPVLGVPLPLISAGGSSLIAVLAAIGVVVSVNRERPVDPSLASMAVPGTTAPAAPRGARAQRGRPGAVR